MNEDSLISIQNELNKLKDEIEKDNNFNRSEITQFNNKTQKKIKH